MNDPVSTQTRPRWFVGSRFQNTDHTQNFVEQGIWQCDIPGTHQDNIKSMQPGDRIAIKAAYTRKHDVPFPTNGHHVSVMAIKAIGTIQEVHDDLSLRVDWQLLDTPREWYFFTFRTAIWRVQPTAWLEEALIAFTFDNAPQDYDRFRNAPYWRERFGDAATTLVDARFAWTQFYEEFATQLLAYKDNRAELLAKIHAVTPQLPTANFNNDQFSDGTIGPMRDICPFTLMSSFNRGITHANRTKIAATFAKILDITAPAPERFDSIPLVNNQRSWFTGYAKDRNPDDIDKLWEVFIQAIQLADSDEDDNEAIRERFRLAYDQALQIKGIRWMLTFGLFWIRPWYFPPLDTPSRTYIETPLNLPIARNSPKNCASADDYLALLDALGELFLSEDAPARSFPELSWNAYHQQTHPLPDEDEDNDEDTNFHESPSPASIAPLAPYTLRDILAEGSFLPLETLQNILDHLQTKKNLILQGPPGTGKTWLARRMAYALIGQRDEHKVRAVQFHPNLSYEDFVHGWRPGASGRLELIDGPFLKAAHAARQQPDNSAHVLVIEEINRGNPAQIFGEFLTLLEADKRQREDAIELTYQSEDAAPFFVPPNLYIIGTMNVADRSLALVDFALRRRFAFVDLKPSLNQIWRAWMREKFGFDDSFLQTIQTRISLLNQQISDDPNLGEQFQIGHSFVTPPVHARTRIQAEPSRWFRQVVESEIGPLLDEYWFDSLQIAQQARASLLEGV